MDKMNPKVSIVVPVYNAQDTISSLIKSVLSQEEQSWELLLVDDGSKDDTPRLCDEASSRDARVKTIHQKNQGVSAARNRGLQSAQGNWITFVDADDLLTDSFLSSLVRAAEQSQEIDLAYCSYAIVENGRTTISLNHSCTYILSLGGVNNAFLNTKILYRCSPWAKLFRRSIIEEHNLFFDTNLSISEDRLFLYNYLPYVRGIATSATMGYIYGSFSSTSLKHKKHQTDVLVHRQKAMTEGLRKVYQTFSLNPQEEQVMWSHLMRILVETMECVYYHNGCGKRTEAIQTQIFRACFPEDMYLLALQNKVWKKKYDGDTMLQLVIQGKFHEYNSKLWWRDLNLSIRQVAHKLLRKKSPQGSYQTAISLIN